MLEFIEMTSMEDRKHWDRPELSKWTFVVPDISKKFELQAEMLKTARGISDEQVLRLREFILLLHRRLFPAQKVVSREFLQTHVGEFLQENAEFSFLHPRCESFLIDWIEYFHPLYLHSNVEEALRDAGIFEAQAELDIWWTIGKTFFHSCCQRGWILASWGAALVNSSDREALAKVWGRPLRVEMGASFSQVELDLFENLSEVLDVQLIVPALAHFKMFPFKGSLLESLYQRSRRSEVPTKRAKANGDDVTLVQREETRVHQFANPLLECQFVVAQARAWLEQGLRPEQLAIVSPQIESYWSVLSTLLDAEGIPYQKPIVCQVSNQLSVQQWLSRLRLQKTQISYGDLETFLAAENWIWRSERLQAAFRNIMNRESLASVSEVFERLDQKIRDNEKQKLEEWLAIALLQIPSSLLQAGVLDGIMTLCHRLVDSTPEDVQLKFLSWVQYVESLASAIEITEQEGDSSGCRIGNLSVGEAQGVSRRIYVGLQDSAFSIRRLNLRGVREIQSAAAKAGFFLNSPDENDVDFDFRWQFHVAPGQCIFTSSERGWDGSVQMMHPLLLDLKSTPPVLSPCRWNQLQDSFDSSSLPQRGERLSQRQLQNFSAAAIEDFLQCPFIYSIKRDFCLLDEADVDLDPDDRTLGVLNHKLLEKLSLHPRFPEDPEWSDSDWQNFMNSVREEVLEGTEESGIFSDDLTWPSTRKKLVRTGKEFLSYERERSQEFPNWRIRNRELEIDAYFNLDSARWETSSVASSEALRFRGRVDRVDHKLIEPVRGSDEPRGNSVEELWIFDYKRGSNSPPISKWLEEDKFQLGIYASALEDLESSRSRIAGASYYSYRGMDCTRGFLVGHFPKRYRKEGVFNLDHWSEVSSQIRARVVTVLKQMQEGRYLPEPRDPEICSKCRWKGVCNAQHLA